MRKQGIGWGWSRTALSAFAIAGAVGVTACTDSPRQEKPAHPTAPAYAAAGSGSVWSQLDDCLGTQQDINHYGIGHRVALHGDNLTAGTYTWAIWGNPGGSSGDPGDTVATGSIHISATGVASGLTGALGPIVFTNPATDSAAFCFIAYKIKVDDWGEYRFAIGSKNDNYRVDGLTGIDKTVSVDWKRAYTWTITKTATPTALDIFLGESAVSHYEVALTKSADPTADRYAVSGNVSITNPGTMTALVHVKDCLQMSANGSWVTVGTCQDLADSLVPGTATLPYSFTNLTLLRDSTYMNAIVLDDSAVKRVAVAFPTTPTSTVNDSVHVTDTHGGAWSFTASGSQTYNRTFTCGNTPGTSPDSNIATISELSKADTAVVTTTCRGLSVTKTANPTLTRTWTWGVTKTNDTPTATIASGETLPIGYTIVFSATPANSDWASHGNIVVTNPHPTRKATLTAVTDALTGSISGVVHCDSLTVPAAGSLTCTYTAGLPDATTRTNTATATQQLYTFDAAGTPTAGGTHDYSGTASVDFASATIKPMDDCIAITDTYSGPYAAGAGVPSTLCQDASVKTFTYTRNVLFDPGVCGLQNINNTVAFETDSLHVTGSDDAPSAITVACHPSCTLTQGYWKTHSLHGPAPYDDGWLYVGTSGADEVFAHGITYWTNLWTAPSGGNAYYQLSHQYIAAMLNIGNGATAPSSVTSAMSQAAAFFANAQYTPAYIGALKGSSGLRKQYLDLAGTLGAFNEGTIGPGHCTER